VRALNILAILLAGSLLAGSRAASGQSGNVWDSIDANGLTQQVIQLANQGRYLEAVPLAQRALALREKALGPESPDVAASLNNLANLYSAEGRYADAEPLYMRSLALQEKALGAEHPDVADALNNLANLYSAEGRYADAEPLYKRSLVIVQKNFGADHPDVAQSLRNMAGLYLLQGRYIEAEPLYKRSLAIQEKALGPEHPQVAAALHGLGLLYTHEGRYADAEPLYRQALTIQEKALGPESPDVAASLNSLAGLYHSEGRNSDAEPLYRRSLALHEKLHGATHPHVAASLNNLANLYEGEGRYADAEPLLKRSLAIQETLLGPDHPDVAFALNGVAFLYEAEGRYVDAQPLFKRSLAIQEKGLGSDHPNVAVTLKALAHLYEAQGRYADAEPLYKRSLTINEKVLGTNHPALALSLDDLAWIYALTGRYADALPLVRRAAQMGHPHQSIYLGVLLGAVEKSLIPYTDAFDEGYQLFQGTTSSTVSKAVNQLAIRFAAGSDQLVQLVRKAQDLSLESERLDKLLIEATSKEPSQRDPNNEQQIRNRRQAIADERIQVETTLSQEFPDYAELGKPKPLSAQETQDLLADDEALIVFDFHGLTGYAAVFTRSSTGVFQLKATARDLEAQIKALRTSLASQFDQEGSYALYRSIFDPFAERIASKTRVSVVTNGALTSLPLQLLVASDPAGKKLQDVDWLVRKFAITILPSTASLKILREGKVATTAAQPMIGFGDPVFEKAQQIGTKQGVVNLNRTLPDFYRGVIVDVKSLAEALTPPPETADELRAVAGNLGAKAEDIELGEAATVTNVKHARLDDYRVVYFATHALVAGEVEKFAKVKAEPSLVLSIPERPTEEDDGLLRASDIAMLKMNADFVVLSACNTAAGDKPGAEALSGLAQAFFYAGARSLLVSNWDVDSEATVALMIGVFDALKRDPHLSHAEALRLSMLRMIDHPTKPEWAQPKFWAPFIVVGEPQKN
jgi:CHAT domain-containing protein/Tfp pilus assembly protein PilF